MTLLRVLCLLLYLLPASGLAQSLRLSGKITDAGGEALPFATVYAEGTSRGTTANSEGEYFLNLPAGTYKVTFRYVGYGSRTETVALADRPVVLNVQLAQESLRLNEVTVRADGKYEDPAYAIIRNAIAKRKFYLGKTGNFACDAYVKGLTRMLKAPRKIMGQDVSIPGVDSSGKGILYLSESVSKLYVQGPKVKEVMVSSKVSGRDNGFSFNTAAGIHEWNFYENLIKTDFNERGFVSPIAQGALLMYDYKLIGTSTENGLQVHKIEVTPKRRTDPAFGGFIYIQEESWRIHATDLLLTQASGVEMLDTLSIHQVYIPVKPGTWLPGTVEFT
ncbi:MAG: carboxypeptidase-like regulatory domain-containing protein, partial [Cytophagales bacterium]|nr:carboxypeptidase-like regulatory domain-containing protein [Cytophagales bacterium]